jgi:hypothetical protein
MFLILPENARATPAKTRHGGKIQAFYDFMSIFLNEYADVARRWRIFPRAFIMGTGGIVFTVP